MNSESGKKTPQIEITKLTPFLIQFTLKNSDVATANTLRRTLIAGVPTLAIETVDIYENSSSLNDEFIVHRLGLIPIVCKNNPRFEGLVNNKLCNCSGGCKKCTVEFRLNVTCTSSEVRKVTSRDLICEDPKLYEPAHFICPEDENGEINGIRIIDLNRGETLNLKATATIVCLFKSWF